MIIVIGGQKGGTGKTTYAVNFAVMRAKEGKDVYLYDIDQKQNTSTIWASTRDSREIQPRIQNGMRVFDQLISNQGQVVRNDLKDLIRKHDDIIVDIGGGANEVFKSAISMADIIIFPVSPGDFDMWTFATLNAIVSDFRKDENIKALIVLNKLTPQPFAAQEEIKECDDYLDGLENLKRIESYLHIRKPIRKASGSGLAIIEAKPEDEKAILEIKSIYQEVFNGK